MQCMARRTYTELLLGFALVVCATAAVVAAPQFEAAQPVPPQDSTDRKDDTDRKAVLPLPEAGKTEHFRYERDSGGMYWIIPTDGSQSYLVSASFLQIALDTPQLDSFQQAEVLRTYPALMQEMFTKTMAQMYPDGTAEYEVPFPTQVFEGTDGTQVLMEQDPAAAPYVWVRLTGGGREAVEFSVARAVVEQMLANEQSTDDQLLQGLRSFPFPLPEAARAGDFARLSAAELAILVQQEPELRRYEFIQMGQFSRDSATDRSAETPRQQRKPRERQRPAAVSPAAAPLGVQQRPALAQLPSQIPATRRTGEQPPSGPGTYTPSIDRLSPQVAEPLQRSPNSRTEAASAPGIRTSVVHLGLRIVAISLFALGIIALVVSRRTR
jgi:hypothetical protein